VLITMLCLLSSWGFPLGDSGNNAARNRSSTLANSTSVSARAVSSRRMANVCAARTRADCRSFRIPGGHHDREELGIVLCPARPEREREVDHEALVAVRQRAGSGALRQPTDRVRTEEPPRPAPAPE